MWAKLKESVVTENPPPSAWDVVDVDKKDASGKTALLNVCEKGNRKRMETCRSEVQAALDSKRAARFKQCVGSKQAQPRLVRVDDKEKNPELPRWSEWLAEESKFAGQKWYIVFCDPSLPEARFDVEGDEEL